MVFEVDMQESAPTLRNGEQPLALTGANGSQPREPETPLVVGGKGGGKQAVGGGAPPGSGNTHKKGKGMRKAQVPPEVKAEKKRLDSIVKDANSVKTQYNAATTSCDALLSLIETAKEWSWANNDNDTRRLKDARQAVSVLVTEFDKDFFVHDKDFVKSKYGNDWEQPTQLMKTRVSKPVQKLEVENSRLRQKHYVETEENKDKDATLVQKKRKKQ